MKTLGIAAHSAEGAALCFLTACRGVFKDETKDLFLRAIDDFKGEGAECVILGCTEIPLVVTPADSSLPLLDSTRLLAKQAVREALNEEPVPMKAGWLEVRP